MVGSSSRSTGSPDARGAARETASASPLRTILARRHPVSRMQCDDADLKRRAGRVDRSRTTRRRLRGRGCHAGYRRRRGRAEGPKRRGVRKVPRIRRERDDLAGERSRRPAGSSPRRGAQEGGLAGAWRALNREDFSLGKERGTRADTCRARRARKRREVVRHLKSPAMAPAGAI